MARSVMKASPARRALVRKADPKDGDFIAAYDQHGRLIGIVDPEKITPVANADGTAGKPAASDKSRPSTEADAGEDPQADLQKRMAQVRKGLYSGGTATEQAELAERLNRAAIKGLGIIFGRGAA